MYHHCYCLQYLEEFHSYLDDWERSVSNLKEIDHKEKKCMTLSDITNQGIGMTSMSMNITIALFKVI